MSHPPDQIGLRARIAWHVAFYVFALTVYLLLADGEGRYETTLRVMVFVWPAVAALDVLRARRRANRD